jgi:ABC-type nitrate/sulfonate/bicarbonate transport system substrate-binding protein
MSRATIHFLKSKHPLRVGFLPESACAPLVYAQEAGLFAKYDLDVELRRETSSAELRDKVVQGALEAAHAPATLPFLTNLDRDSDDCACVCGAVLSLQGNAITISRQMWSQGVRDARILREQIYQQWGQKTFTFGVPSLLSSQSFLLRKWLQSGGILPSLGVRIVPIPPAQMFPVLKLGYIDGYCAGEPWTSLAVQAKAGVCVATRSPRCWRPARSATCLRIVPCYARCSPSRTMSTPRLNVSNPAWLDRLNSAITRSETPWN